MWIHRRGWSCGVRVWVCVCVCVLAGLHVSMCMFLVNGFTQIWIVFFLSSVCISMLLNKRQHKGLVAERYVPFFSTSVLLLYAPGVNMWFLWSDPKWTALSECVHNWLQNVAPHASCDWISTPPLYTIKHVISVQEDQVVLFSPNLSTQVLSLCVCVSARASLREVERRVRRVWMTGVQLHCEERFGQLKESIDHYMVFSVDVVVVVTNKSMRRENICLIHSESAAQRRSQLSRRSFICGPGQICFHAAVRIWTHVAQTSSESGLAWSDLLYIRSECVPTCTLTCPLEIGSQ